MKVVSWNVNSVIARLDRVLAFLKKEEPDVLCLQELKCMDEKFPKEAFENAGYHFEVYGQKAYNGVALISKEKLTDVERGFDGLNDVASRAIGGTLSGVRIYSLYVPNGKDIADPAFQYKLNWLKSLQKFLKNNFSAKDKVMLLGDFNIAHTDLDVYDPVRWKGKLHCSEPERDILQEILDTGYVDSYRALHPEGKDFSWWDYRNLSFVKNYGLRIDYVYCSNAMKPSIKNTWMMREERKGEKPSDHVPVICEVNA